MNHLPSERPQETAAVRETRERPKDSTVVIPTATLWGMKSGGRAGIFPYSQVYTPYIHPLEQTLAQADAAPRSSSLADIAEVARGQNAVGFRPTKMVPWAFAQEAEQLTREAAAAKRRGEEPPLAYEMYRSFLEGSDFDVRIAVKPADMKSWTEQLVTQTMERYRTKRGYTPEPERTQDGKLIWTIPLDEAPIVMQPRGSLAHSTLSEYTHPVIRITYKEFADSKIAACDWQIIAREPTSIPGIPEAADVPLATIGISPRPEMLSEEQRRADTRMGLKVNSWDRIDDAVMTQDVPAQVRNDVSGHTSGRYDDVSDSGLVALPPFRDTHLITSPDGTARVMSGSDFTHTFITLSAEQTAALNRPIAFGPDFGASYIAPETTLIEAFRVLRKGLRYISIEESEQTDRARQLIAGDTLRKRLSPSPDANRPQWWQKDIAREAATACWISPKEFLALGDSDNFNLAQYFPNWKYLAEIAPLLPSREEIERQMIAISETGKPAIGDRHGFLETLKTQGVGGAMDLVKTIDSERKAGERIYAGGWKVITHEVRRMNEARKGTLDYSPEIAARGNDLELMFWLLATNF